MCEIEAPSTLQTPRLTLRAPRAGDAPAIAEFAADWDIARMTTRIPHPYGLEEARAYLAAVESEDPARERTFLIEQAEAGPVGIIGLHPEAAPWPNLGYWIGKPFWGRGYATEAAKGLLSWARQAQRRKVVASSHFADNPASGRVLEKAGFLYTGEVVAQMSLARGEPAAARKMVWLA